MKKILTAINNPILNEELKKEKNFKIIGRDIQYKEAILEILEKDNNINLIIISEKILGEIKLEKLIEKIKNINEKIKIIFILEKENIEIEKILIKYNIKDIYYNNKINLKELIKIINKKEINMEEEIIKLKKIIEEKNINRDKKEKIKNTYNNVINKKVKKIINNIINKKEKDKNNSKKSITKIITFSGNYKSGKSTLALIISQYLAEKKYKVLLIDGDLEKQDLSTFFKKKEKNKIYNKFFYKKNKLKIKKGELNNKFKKLINKRNKISYYKVKKIDNYKNKIKYNLDFFYGLNYLLKKQKSLNKIILNFLTIKNKQYNFIIIDLSKNNPKNINKEILKISHINFICIEANLLGIKECKKMLKVYFNKWKIKKEKVQIIINKKNNISINKNIIAKILSIKNKIFIIKENKLYFFIYKDFFRNKVIIKNKKILNDINKIMKKIIIVNNN